VKVRTKKLDLVYLRSPKTIFSMILDIVVVLPVPGEARATKVAGMLFEEYSSISYSCVLSC
jgi:hypothetical protein